MKHYRKMAYILGGIFVIFSLGGCGIKETPDAQDGNGNSQYTFARGEEVPVTGVTYLFSSHTIGVNYL